MRRFFLVHGLPYCGASNGGLASGWCVAGAAGDRLLSNCPALPARRKCFAHWIDRIKQVVCGGEAVENGCPGSWRWRVHSASEIVARSEVVTVEVAGGAWQWDAAHQLRCLPNLERKGLTHANLIFYFSAASLRIGLVGRGNSLLGRPVRRRRSLVLGLSDDSPMPKLSHAEIVVNEN